MTITVLSPELVPLGLVNKYIALMWTSKTSEVGDFELQCPIIEENVTLLKEENLIWIGGDEVGVIETIQNSIDGRKEMKIQGRFIESWMDRRIIKGSYSQTAKTSTHIRNLIFDQAISPGDSKRKLPFLSLDDQQDPLGEESSFSTSYTNLLETCQSLAQVDSLMLKIRANVPAKLLKVLVQKGVDRSIEQNINTPVILSTELGDILKSDYLLDLSSWDNMALIAGAGEGDKRKFEEINSELTGLARRELFVDARDIQDYEEWPATIRTTVFSLEDGKTQITIETTKTNPNTGEKTTTTITKNGDGTETPGVTIEETTVQVAFSDTVYSGMLRERGKAKLLENPKIQSFDADIRTFGTRVYEYGKDYFLGDRITMQDQQLGVQISTEISEVQQSWSEKGFQIYLSLGTTAPTITQLLKRRI